MPTGILRKMERAGFQTIIGLGNRPTLCDDSLCFVSIHNSSAQSDVHRLVAGITHML
jgi:hypothetical protein